MDAAVDASEESEVLLPEVVAQSLAGSPFSVLPAGGRCVGVTHPGDLSLVQEELTRQVASGGRPARLWPSLHCASGVVPRVARHGPDRRTGRSGLEHRVPDATQPRVTVRPKPPVLLGATSATARWHRAGVVSDNPRPAGPGDSREVTVTHHGQSQSDPPAHSGHAPLAGLAPFPRSRFAAFSRLPPFRLAASLRASLAPTFGARLRFGGLLSPNWTQVAPPVTRGQWRSAKSRRSPHVSSGHPQASPSQSPVLPHVAGDHNPSSRRCRRTADESTASAPRYLPSPRFPAGGDGLQAPLVLPQEVSGPN